MKESRVRVSREIAASAETVWALLSDVTRMSQWSPETSSVEWTRGAEGPVPGARFRGHNRRAWRRWSTRSEVVEAEVARTFAFEVTSIGLRVARWSYRVEPAGGGCRVEESWEDQRGAVIRVLGVLVTGVADRATHNRATMIATLDNLAVAAEAP